MDNNGTEMCEMEAKILEHCLSLIYIVNLPFTSEAVNIQYQRCHLPTISQCNDVAKPQRRLMKVVAENVEMFAEEFMGVSLLPLWGVWNGCSVMRHLRAM